MGWWRGEHLGTSPVMWHQVYSPGTRYWPPSQPGLCLSLSMENIRAQEISGPLRWLLGPLFHTEPGYNFTPLSWALVCFMIISNVIKNIYKITFEQKIMSHQ